MRGKVWEIEVIRVAMIVMEKMKQNDISHQLVERIITSRIGLLLFVWSLRLLWFILIL
jgi:hypothetical protein